MNNVDQTKYAVVYYGGKIVSGEEILKTGMEIRVVDSNKTYAKYTVIVTGDISGDGKINITDLISIKSHILKKSKLTGYKAMGGDVNGDGKINITDFIKIKGYILKKNSIPGVRLQNGD